MLSLPWLFIILSILQFTHQEKYTCRSRAPCGCSKRVRTSIIGKIVGGETVTKQTWGWIASLTDSSNHRHFCAGSILSSSWILTAAHCLKRLDASDIIINAGSNRLNESIQKRHVAKIISHPNYNPKTFVNDIALLQLSSPLDMTDDVLAKICLPLEKASLDPENGNVIYKYEYPPVDSSLVAIGWGVQAEKATLLTEELQQVTLKTIDYESGSCKEWIASQPAQFCAGVEGGGKDTCQGDSGGPLMKFASSKQWVIAGVTSFGAGCARAEHSGVYTRVTFYSDWINSTINAEDTIANSAVHIHDGLTQNEATNNVPLGPLEMNTGSGSYSFSLLNVMIVFGSVYLYNCT